MKDVYEVFDDYFLLLNDSIKQLNFIASVTISTDLIKFAEMSGFEEGIFIGEILESTFNQVSREMAQYTVSDTDVNNLIKTFTKNINLISECYKETDKNNLFNALQNIRVNATKFQYYMRRQCKPKAQSPPFPFPFPVR